MRGAVNMAYGDELAGISTRAGLLPDGWSRAYVEERRRWGHVSTLDRAFHVLYNSTSNYGFEENSQHDREVLLWNQFDS